MGFEAVAKAFDWPSFERVYFWVPLETRLYTVLPTANSVEEYIMQRFGKALIFCVAGSYDNLRTLSRHPNAHCC